MEKNIIILESIYEGGTYQGAKLEFETTIDDIDYPVSMVGAIVFMDIKNYNTVVTTYSTDNGKLTVTGNAINIVKHDPELKAGIYEFDLHITMPNGDKEPGIAQGEWTIKEPKTKRT